LAVLGLGIGLVAGADAWDFRKLWVQHGLGLFAAAFLIGAVWQSRTGLVATRAARDDDTEARRQLRHWSWGYRLVVLLLVAAAWDMTTKPVCERNEMTRQPAQGAAAERRAMVTSPSSS
jgi:hypothetical protein